jgi:hypothetical protein
MPLEQGEPGAAAVGLNRLNTNRRKTRKGAISGGEIIWPWRGINVLSRKGMNALLRRVASVMLCKEDILAMGGQPHK